MESEQPTFSFDDILTFLIASIKVSGGEIKIPVDIVTGGIEIGKFQVSVADEKTLALSWVPDEEQP